METQEYANAVKMQFALDRGCFTVPITVTDDGHRHTFYPPGNAIGCEEFSKMRLNYVATLKSNGARRANWRYLWPIEELVYSNERRRIVGEMLRGLNEAKGEFEGALNFFTDFDKALARIRAADTKPKPPSNAKLKIKQVSGRWWLFHRQWTPLCFDSFEEATSFAKRYILRIRTHPSPVAA